MMKWLKVFSLLMTLSALSHLEADDQNDNWNRYYKQQPKPKQKDRFLVDVGAVYLRPYQGGTDFAQLVSFNEVNPSNLPTPQIPYGKNKTLDFDYSWGVRGSLGYEEGKSRQTVRATYLYVAPSAHKSTHTDFENINIPYNLAVHSTDIDNGTSGIGDYVNSAHSHWNLHFNMLDLTFGKKFTRNSCMNFEPFIGAKGLLISQTQKSTFFHNSAGNTGKLEQKVNFKGAGVMGGLSLDWVLTNWLSLIGSVDGALLYSSIKTERKSDNGVPTVLWTGNSHDIEGISMLEATFGVRGVYCWKKGRFIDLKIGFEEHYLFQAMKHYLINSDSSTNLSLMGWFAMLGAKF